MSSKPNQKKRTFGEAFGQTTYESERYNQEISEDYFTKGGIGHGVYTNTINRPITPITTINSFHLQFLEKQFKNK